MRTLSPASFAYVICVRHHRRHLSTQSIVSLTPTYAIAAYAIIVYLFINTHVRHCSVRKSIVFPSSTAEYAIAARNVSSLSLQTQTSKKVRVISTAVCCWPCVYDINLTLFYSIRFAYAINGRARHRRTQHQHDMWLQTSKKVRVITAVYFVFRL